MRIGFAVIFLLSFQIVNAQWKPTNGLVGFTVNSFAVKDSTFFVCTDSGIYSSSDKGMNWLAMSNGLTSLKVNALAITKETIFAGTAAGIFNSTDNGSNWLSVLTNTSISSFTISGTNIYAGVNSGVGGIYRSTNMGINWVIINTGLPSLPVYSLVSKDSCVIAAIVGEYPQPAGIYRSTNNGSSWSIATQLPEGACALSSSGDIVFATLGLTGVVVSTNNGLLWTWQNLNGLPQTFVTSIFIYGNYVFAGLQGGGVYKTANLGQQWIPVNEGIENKYVSAEYVWRNYIYAGLRKFYVRDSSNNAVWCRPLSEITNIKTEKKEVPEDFVLEQNYPNPFNPSTNITYSLPLREFVTLKVFDILGKEITTLVNEEKPAGEYKVQFNATNLPTGVYFYRINSGNYTETKKLIVLK